MSRVRGSIEIARGAEEVLDVVADQRSGPARIAGPLNAVIGRRQERRIWTGLKRMLEGGRP